MLLGEVGVAEVHVDLGARDGRHVGRSRRRGIGGRFLETMLLTMPAYTVPLEASTAISLAVLNRGRGLLRAACRADDARNAHLAADDGGVAGHAAGIGDDGERLLHGGHPVGRGHGRDEDLAVPLNSSMRAGSVITCALPATLPGEAGRPVTMTSRFSVPATSASSATSPSAFLRDQTVSGRAWSSQTLAIALVDAPLHVHVAAVVLLELLGVVRELP